MELELVVTAGLGDNSYLIASGDEAAVVDPQRDVGRYLALARDRRVAIRYALETRTSRLGNEKQSSQTSKSSLPMSMISGLIRGHGSPISIYTTRTGAPICGAAIPRPLPNLDCQSRRVSLMSSTMTRTA